ncbi:MAG TPA: ABC transporter permease [Dyella sp.]|uniref:ABC transporter permease n=1 Tax=Dyella sp. TaxID=1869338 RepID=UPI002C873C94|nr:ABC transporter permease [Dyella sp.]HTV84366.1 ABC transporter permease [Dyella sp.]
MTALVIALLAFGVSACMVSYAVFRATTSDPIPAKSSHLYVPQVDSFGPTINWNGNEPSPVLTYMDAIALWQARKARRQTLLYPATWQMESDNQLIEAMPLGGDAVTSDFFPMFDVPFRFGAGWSPNDDAQHATVAVISRRLNDKLFGGQNSVGREIRLDGKIFRIAGVLDNWNPKPRFFDIASLGIPEIFGDTGDIYTPFTRAIDMKKGTKYDLCPSYSADLGISDWDKYLRSECTWIDAWVELPTPTDVERYREFLRNYSEEQRRGGRFSWAPNIRLRNLMEWMAHEHVTPKASTLSLLVSTSFLLIVMVNVVGLMLARFMRRAPEIGIRRALGASRAAVYLQFLIEGATIGCAGGLLGVALTLLGVWGAGGLFEPRIARIVHADASLIALTVLLAVAATVISALYPTWRAARIQPAWQIKINS